MSGLARWKVEGPRIASSDRLPIPVTYSNRMERLLVSISFRRSLLSDSVCYVDLRAPILLSLDTLDNGYIVYHI